MNNIPTIDWKTVDHMPTGSYVVLRSIGDGSRHLWVYPGITENDLVVAPSVLIKHEYPRHQVRGYHTTVHGLGKIEGLTYDRVVIDGEIPTVKSQAFKKLYEVCKGKQVVVLRPPLERAEEVRKLFESATAREGEIETRLTVPDHRVSAREVYREMKAILDRRTSGHEVRYCPECSRIGEIAEQYIDCCPDGIRAVYTTRDVAEQAKAGAAQQAEAEPVVFGSGKKVVKTGTYDRVPAVFVCDARQPGKVGASAERENTPLNCLQPGEIVLTFPTDQQAERVADALCNTSPDPAPVVPEGYALVPIEPTDDMLCVDAEVAGNSHWHGDIEISERRLRRLWAEMVSAAPQPAKAPTRDEVIQCLLATAGQSEGVAADAILDLMRSAGREGE